MTIGQANGEVGARAGIFERRELLAVEPGPAGLEIGVVRLPGGNRIVLVDPGGLEDGVGQLGDGDVLWIVGEDQLGPVGRGVGDDVPVDVEAGDQLQRRTIGGRIGAVGP